MGWGGGCVLEKRFLSRLAVILLVFLGGVVVRVCEIESTGPALSSTEFLCHETKRWLAPANERPTRRRLGGAAASTPLLASFISSLPAIPPAPEDTHTTHRSLVALTSTSSYRLSTSHSFSFGTPRHTRAQTTTHASLSPFSPSSAMNKLASRSSAAARTTACETSRSDLATARPHWQRAALGTPWREAALLSTPHPPTLSMRSLFPRARLARCPAADTLWTHGPRDRVHAVCRRLALNPAHCGGGSRATLSSSFLRRRPTRTPPRKARADTAAAPFLSLFFSL